LRCGQARGPMIKLPAWPASRALPRLEVRHYLVAGIITFTVSLVLREAIELVSTVGLMRDAIGYWIAGEHVRSGQALYFDEGLPFGSDVFLFAPWFAWAWAPLTLLPRELVFTCWFLAMCAATVWAIRPFFRLGVTGIALGCLLGYCLARGALWANVMPLLVGVLIHTHGKRSFPVWVGLSASLKVLPILYMWPDLVDHRWRRVSFAVGIMVVLWAPAFFYGIANYPTGFAPTLSLLQISGYLWAGVAALAVLAAFLTRHGRYRWLTTTVAILAIYPRLHLHYIGLIGVGNLPADRG
jgi:hypothetical protein